MADAEHLVRRPCPSPAPSDMLKRSRIDLAQAVGRACPPARHRGHRLAVFASAPRTRCRGPRPALRGALLRQGARDGRRVLQPLLRGSCRSASLRPKTGCRPACTALPLPSAAPASAPSPRTRAAGSRSWTRRSAFSLAATKRGRSAASAPSASRRPRRRRPTRPCACRRCRARRWCPASAAPDGRRGRSLADLQPHGSSRRWRSRCGPAGSP